MCRMYLMYTPQCSALWVLWAAATGFQNASELQSPQPPTLSTLSQQFQDVIEHGFCHLIILWQEVMHAFSFQVVVYQIYWVVVHIQSSQISQMQPWKPCTPLRATLATHCRRSVYLQKEWWRMIVIIQMMSRGCRPWERGYLICMYVKTR